MAGNGDSFLFSQPSICHSGGSRRRSDVVRRDDSIGRRKSGQSVATSSIQSGERRLGSAHTYGTRGTIQSSETSSTSPLNLGHLPVRTVPVWVLNPPRDTTTPISPRSIPPLPSEARIAKHHYQEESSENEFARESKWKPFTHSTMYAQAVSSAEKERVDEDWLNTNFGDYSEPWQGGNDETDLESGFDSMGFNQRRKRFVKRFQRTILQSPMIPLIIRLTVFVYSTAALALGGSLRHYATKYDHPQGSSAEMAIVVDAVALIYLVYITWDEYTGKPLGLRPAGAKLRLIFLDLIFIVFGSANLSLAFESLSDITGSCKSGKVNDVFDPENDVICDRQKALASVLLVALVAWLLTFSISVLRVVERVTAK